MSGRRGLEGDCFFRLCALLSFFSRDRVKREKYYAAADWMAGFTSYLLPIKGRRICL